MRVIVVRPFQMGSKMMRVGEFANILSYDAEKYAKNIRAIPRDVTTADALRLVNEMLGDNLDLASLPDEFYELRERMRTTEMSSEVRTTEEDDADINR